MSTNLKIKEMLPKEYAMLWDLSKHQTIDKRLRELVTGKVRSARDNFRSNQGKDLLARKLNDYGNEGNWGMNQIRRFNAALYDDKRPPNAELGQWLSVELEVVMPDKGAEVSFVSYVKKMNYSNFVTVKDDGSIKLRRCECEEHYDEDLEEIVISHADDCKSDLKTAYGREIIITFKFGDWEFVQNICKKLNEIKVTVNKTCGMHVHFDMRHLENARKVGIVAQRVAKTVPALKGILPASRSDNEYCSKPINRSSDSNGRHSRYAFVNVQSYEKHKTLEIRGHSGTTDATKIINWIRLLKIIMDKPNRREVLTVENMIERFKLDTDLVEYVNIRAAKFSNAKISRAPSDDVASDNETYTINDTQIAFNLDNIGNSTASFSIRESSSNTSDDLSDFLRVDMPPIATARSILTSLDRESHALNEWAEQANNVVNTLADTDEGNVA